MASSVLVNGTQVLLRRRSSAPLTAGRGIEARGLPSLPLSSSSFASVSAGPNRLAVSKRASSVITAVAAPARSSPPGQDEDHKGLEWGNNNNPSSSFDFSTPPPFTLADIRAAIPKHCWVKDTWRSIAYVFRDVAIVFGLAAGAAYVNSWLLWPLYWFAQGTMFWALFVIGHDCGHGSFSSSKAVNNVIGHLTHSSILVPYHGWRISHRTHHQNHGHVDNDESWHPLPESAYRNLDPLSKLGRFSILSMFAYPLYLWRRSPGKTGSHFNPESPLFHPSERNDVITSSVCCAVMVGLLAALTVVMGPLWMFKLYVVPYLMNVVWLDAVTYLHHHGHEDKVPWYRGQEWNYMRGGLSTIDRDYGLFNNIHHDIGTHVLHHLFPQIPHYNLIEATEAVKPVLGSFYREPEKSGPFPVHLVGALVKSLSNDHFVKDEGNVVFYESDQAKK